MKKKFYITTPIYYTSANLHIGHSYSTVAADAMARYKRLQGEDVCFLTGTDEHGLKIQTNAAKAGKDPQAFVDELVAGIQDLWKLMDISYDRFIRTTDEHHKKSVQAIFQKLYDQGDIYKSRYEGWYCTSCESFWTESQLGEGHSCPDCGGPVQRAEEESYFFRLSKYQDRLIRLYEEHPEFIQPESRANEMLNNFLRPGLQDLAVSRTSFDWGIPVPFDPKHVIYVWIDALSNYITALGYPDQMEDFEKYWPADVHLVGKEIVRFHTIIWPALLMALDLPLPKQVYGHGWILFKEGKMSKSKGNIVDPVKLCARYGVDAIRYFLLREVPFGSDGSYSNEALIARINADLANDLGNLLSRTTAMMAKYFEGKLPGQMEAGPEDEALEKLAAELRLRYHQAMEGMQFSQALAEVWRLINAANKYIDQTMPWILAKEEARRPRLACVLSHLAESLRLVAHYIQPAMPTTAQKMRELLHTEDADEEWKVFRNEEAIQPAAPLFPRLDLEEEIEAMNALLPAASEKADREKEKTAPKKQAQPKEPHSEKKEKEAPEGIRYLDFEDFLKVEMRLGQITACEKVEGADKLLKETVDMGDHSRTIVSGIAPWYAPEDLVGKRVVVVTNLKPRKLRGILSEGMLLAASDAEGNCRLLTVDGELAAGSEVG